MVKKLNLPSGKWKTTSQTGVRYREHPNRRHGTKPDRYYQVRFKASGKQVTECYGWASEGWTLKKVAAVMTEMKHELKSGSGSGKLADRRQARIEQLERDRKKKAVLDRQATSYEDYFSEQYWPDISQDKKPAALKAEDSLHRNWILPTIGSVPIRELGELHVKKVSRKMARAEKAPRSIEYALACIRMVINHAISGRYHPGPNPVTSLPRGSRPKYDNKRVRFLSRDEARELLVSLRAKSMAVHNMTLLSIYCGLRAGELFSLTWGDVDQIHGLVTLRDTKSGKTRTINMSTSVKQMFAEMEPGKKSDLVFPGKNDKQRKQMSKTFERTVKELKFNDGIEDRRQKVTFHTCRHTCASWLVQAGIPLYTVKEIMGHSTITLTERYSHLAPSAFRQAAEAIEQAAGDQGDSLTMKSSCANNLQVI